MLITWFLKLPNYADICLIVIDDGMKTATFAINTIFPISEKEMIEELLLAETRMNSQSKVRFHLRDCPSQLEDLENKIRAYKLICKLAGIPKFIIDNPEASVPDLSTSEDIKWAREKIEEYRGK